MTCTLINFYKRNLKKILITKLTTKLRIFHLNEADPKLILNNRILLKYVELKQEIAFDVIINYWL